MNYKFIENKKSTCDGCAFKITDEKVKCKKSHTLYASKSCTFPVSGIFKVAK